MTTVFRVGTVGDTAHDGIVEGVPQAVDQRDAPRLLRIQPLHVGKELLVELADGISRAAQRDVGGGEIQRRDEYFLDGPLHADDIFYFLQYGAQDDHLLFTVLPN